MSIAGVTLSDDVNIPLVTSYQSNDIVSHALANADVVLNDDDVTNVEENDVDDLISQLRCGVVGQQEDVDSDDMDILDQFARRSLEQLATLHDANQVLRLFGFLSSNQF